MCWEASVLERLVPEVGLEPTRVISPSDFESDVSTDFTTQAGFAGSVGNSAVEVLC